MPASFDPDAVIGLAGVAIFFCGFGAAWVAKRPKVVEKEVRVPVPFFEPRQKRDARGHFLPGPNPRKRASVADAAGSTCPEALPKI